MVCNEDHFPGCGLGIAGEAWDGPKLLLRLGETGVEY